MTPWSHHEHRLSSQALERGRHLRTKPPALLTSQDGKWLAGGGPKVDGVYLPVNNPRAKGALTVSPVDWMEQSKFCVTNGSTSYFILKPSSTNTRSQVQYFGLTEGDYDVATVGYVKSQLTSLGEEQSPTSLRKLRFARDKDWNNLRPGEFGLMNESNDYVGKWSEARQLYFLNVDSDGNRLMRNENAKDFNSYWVGVHGITSSGERPLGGTNGAGRGLGQAGPQQRPRLSFSPGSTRTAVP